MEVSWEVVRFRYERLRLFWLMAPRWFFGRWNGMWSKFTAVHLIFNGGLNRDSLWEAIYQAFFENTSPSLYKKARSDISLTWAYKGLSDQFSWMLCSISTLFQYVENVFFFNLTLMLVNNMLEWISVKLLVFHLSGDFSSDRIDIRLGPSRLIPTLLGGPSMN